MARERTTAYTLRQEALHGWGIRYSWPVVYF